MAMDIQTPPSSRGGRHSPNMSIDLSDLPPMIQPSPPSNTLLITNLQSPEIFAASNLESIQQAINEHAPIHTFSPLKSMRRIIASFWTVDDAVAIRKVLDGETVLGSRVRVYFGAQTKVEVDEEGRYLHLPKSNKLFFISPPPSPPMGWEMQNEAPPNKEVHAEDLADALKKLHARPGADDALYEQQEQRPRDDRQHDSLPRLATRQRSGTGTVLFDPQDHGHSPADLPAIALEDTSASPDAEENTSPMEGVETEKKFAHTARPPVELMET
ncbi:hypothetical protein LTR36_010747 [Oleoguttula mirabilis]|uniref:Calcipressin n=1 Tax=Oleoguttula mirabilis TaxID=1507867 RepID=A0AAV9JQY2_9PEZI|nr:hypothetical protein LTR36_010747 [Oleoguttula mirabilis]